MMGLHLEISTPEGVVLDTTSDWVSIPTLSGEITILEGHLPIASIVEPGILYYERNHKKESMAIDHGFLFLQTDYVCLMVDQAIHVVDINTSEAEEARKRAEIALEEARQKQADPGEIARLEAKIRFQMCKQLAGNNRN
jgi:F-type H+-transporting ATPase subunit epsilon